MERCLGDDGRGVGEESWSRSEAVFWFGLLCGVGWGWDNGVGNIRGFIFVMYGALRFGAGWSGERWGGVGWSGERWIGGG